MYSDQLARPATGLALRRDGLALYPYAYPCGSRTARHAVAWTLDA